MSSSIWRAGSLAQISLSCASRQFPRLSRHGASLTAIGAVAPLVETAKINHSPELARLRKRLLKRPGIVVRKRGMSAWFDQETGERYAVTLLEVDNVEVVDHRTPEKNGYYAVQIGYGSKNPDKVNKQQLGQFAKAGVNPKLSLKEFQVQSEKGLIPIGTQIKADYFKPDQFVDLKAVSRGKGFAGVMKRYNFKGMNASHGTSLTHRHGGSYGQNQTPGRVLPGKKMPGHMGNHNVTVQNTRVVYVDAENRYILVKGDVPGHKNGYVKIQDAIKKQT